jgi:hypothetical protein
MTSPIFRQLLSGALLATLLPFATSAEPAPRDRSFRSSATLTKEVSQFVRLLEEVHYNRDAVNPKAYADLLSDYMAELDGQRLFFLDCPARHTRIISQSLRYVARSPTDDAKIGQFTHTRNPGVGKKWEFGLRYPNPKRTGVHALSFCSLSRWT